MAKHVSAAEAKAKLSELVAKVAYGGEQYIIERRGKPLAALIAIQDLERLSDLSSQSAGQTGAAALAGLWGDIPDEDIDEMVNTIYEARDRDLSRPVPSFDSADE
ncbi:MAG TPA: type II toxin-antitoxin system Phd/YefM family antitoxin [Chloroflexota bacterium]|nr:type II toxin-antitoxin system Phd/YefM family antitoxin [Chloroflexota bacterium]